MLALDAPRFSQAVTCPARTGVGPDAAVIVLKLSEARQPIQKTTITMDLLSEVLACFNHHTEPNWDGEGAEAVRPGALLETLQFIQWLPESLPMPEVLPEPDGGIALEWFGAPNLAFIASFKGKGFLVYAGMFGKGNSVRGMETLRNLLPNGLLENVRRVAGERNDRV